MDTLEFILGLMRDNYESVGFIPKVGVAEYLADGDFVMQADRRGRKSGYILYGKATPAGFLAIAQHCVDYDKRWLGFGREAFEVVRQRAIAQNCRGIKLRCAEELESNYFWQAMGFELASVQHPDNKRKRAINIYTLDLWPTLWTLDAKSPEPQRP